MQKAVLVIFAIVILIIILGAVGSIGFTNPLVLDTTPLAGPTYSSSANPANTYNQSPSYKQSSFLNNLKNFTPPSTTIGDPNCQGPGKIVNRSPDSRFNLFRYQCDNPQAQQYKLCALVSNNGQCLYSLDKTYKYRLYDLATEEIIDPSDRPVFQNGWFLEADILSNRFLLVLMLRTSQSGQLSRYFVDIYDMQERTYAGTLYTYEWNQNELLTILEHSPTAIVVGFPNINRPGPIAILKDRLMVVRAAKKQNRTQDSTSYGRAGSYYLEGDGRSTQRNTNPTQFNTGDYFQGNTTIQSPPGFLAGIPTWKDVSGFGGPNFEIYTNIPGAIGSYDNYTGGIFDIPIPEPEVPVPNFPPLPNYNYIDDLVNDLGYQQQGATRKLQEVIELVENSICTEKANLTGNVNFNSNTKNWQFEVELKDTPPYETCNPICFVNDPSLEVIFDENCASIYDDTHDVPYTPYYPPEDNSGNTLEDELRDLEYTPYPN